MKRFIRTESSEIRVVRAYQRLGTYKAVADEIGCSWNTVQRICRKHGVNPGQGKHTPGNNGGGSPIKITDMQILDAVKTMTLREISEQYNMHPEALRRRMRRLGVHAKGVSRCKDSGSA